MKHLLIFVCSTFFWLFVFYLYFTWPDSFKSSSRTQKESSLRLRHALQRDRLWVMGFSHSKPIRVKKHD